MIAGFSITSLLLILLAGIGAGFVGYAVGASSLVSYPALLAFGIPPVLANASNTVGVVGTGIGGVMGARKELKGQAVRSITYVVIGAFGGVAGAFLLLKLDPSVFEFAAPVLILLSSLIIAINPRGRMQAKQAAATEASKAPADVTPHTHRKVWWKCAQGHEWQASVHSRAQGTGCPICTNHIPVVGENTLADRFPQIAQEWDYEKNAPLTPEQVLPGTSRRVWWICPNGHSCRTNISSRTSGGNGYPICAGKAVLTGENDLQTKFPEIAAQWDWEKNTDCTPDSVAASSNRRVWWRCEQGHSFCTSIAHRVRYKSECPYCTNKKVLPGFNDLATVKPRLAAQWDPELNGTLTPQMVTAGSHQKVWWKCPAGHRWKAAVYSRAGAQENGCPVCAGRTQGRNIKW